MDVRRLADSLTARLVAFGLFLLLVGLIGRLTILSALLKNDIQEVLAAQQLSLATYVAADIDGKVRARRQLLENLARELPASLLAKPGQLQTWLAERHAVAPLFSLGLMVVRADGDGAIADFPPVTGRRDLGFANLDWFIAARDQGRFAIGKPMRGRITRVPVIIMAVPLKNVGGQTVAVIAGASALDTPGFLDLIQDNTIGRTGGFLLISPRDNIFVASSKPEMRLRTIPPPGVNLLHDRAMAGYRGTGITVNAAGVEELSAMVSVPAADWFVVARLPTAEAFQPVDRIRLSILRHSLILAAVVVVILLAFLAWALRPMKNAARQMREMAEGRLPLEPLPVMRRDEIGDMVEAFNALLEKLRDSEARMAHLAHHDALTGLHNRLSFLSRLQQGAALARRQDNRLAMMFIDLDGFKPINDRFGHDTGDQLLRQVADRLGESVRQADTLARFGGDEFVLLLPDVRDTAAVAAIAEKIVARLATPFRVGDHDLAIGASIGIALFPDDAADADALIAQADAAMYDAKRYGRGCFRFAHQRA
ncbi:MAG: GGDEF domain-containing protein [Pseudomonadota bacterium]